MIERRTYTLFEADIKRLVAEEMTRVYGQPVKPTDVHFSIAEHSDYAAKLNSASATVEIKSNK